VQVNFLAGPFRFRARLETGLAPLTCGFFERSLPMRQRLVHARWSGEACWVPMGDKPLDLPIENATSYPAPGQCILHPGGLSEAELLLAYGAVRFASKVGQLAGNHFLTIIDGLDQLSELGRLALWDGAQDLVVDAD
jgi:hypothetical protein